MATHASARLGRLSDRAITPQRQLIRFRLHKTGFLLPLAWVYRAMVFDVQEDIQKMQSPQVNFDLQQIPLINASQVIFGNSNTTRQPSTPPNKTSRATAPRASTIGLILQEPDGELPLVLPIDSAPALCRVSDTCFVPLPQTYAVRCVAEMTDNSSDYPLHFLLDPQQLVAQHFVQEPSQQQRSMQEVH